MPNPTDPSPLTRVVLVPLSDSSNTPALSLLLEQGTTPTAVVFQQDLLERAKRIEEAWLPAALDEISAVAQMRDHANSSEQPPIVIAYSANAALSAQTIAACVSAGASGVLKPPFDADTARLLRRMVRAAREGRISSTVGLPSQTLSSPRVVSPTDGDEESHRVILPPTALSMGGEHEGEKVLGAFHSYRLGSNSSAVSDVVPTSSRRGSTEVFLTSPTIPITTPLTARTPAPDVTEHDHERFATLLAWNPLSEQRRRSIDVAGLCNALYRAQRAFEVARPMLPANPILDVLAPTEPGHDSDKCCDTQLAELLSAMYYQTQLAINVEMDGYEE